MAGRYSVVTKKRALKRVEELLAEGRAITSACVTVVDQLSQPSIATLSSWARDAGLASSSSAEPGGRRHRTQRPNNAITADNLHPETESTTVQRPKTRPYYPLIPNPHTSRVRQRA